MSLELEEIIAERNKKNKKEEWDFLLDANVYCLAVFFLLIMVMMLSGCENMEQYEKPKMGEFKAQFKANVVPQPKPHQYEVHLSWNGVRNIPPRGWFIRRLDKETGEERIAVRGEAARSFYDERVEMGKNYLYTFGTIEDVGGYFLKAQTEVSIPGETSEDGPHGDRMRKLDYMSNSNPAKSDPHGPKGQEEAQINNKKTVEVKNER